MTKFNFEQKMEMVELISYVSGEITKKKDAGEITVDKASLEYKKLKDLSFETVEEFNAAQEEVNSVSSKYNITI